MLLLRQLQKARAAACQQVRSQALPGGLCKQVSVVLQYQRDYAIAACNYIQREVQRSALGTRL